MPAPDVERDDDNDNDDDPIEKSSSTSSSRRNGAGGGVRRFNGALLAYTILIAHMVAVVFVVVDGKFDAENDVRFELHTREHGIETYEDLKVDPYGRMDRGPTIFDPKRPTRLFVHGFWSSRRAYLRYARAFLKNGDCNFIAVNWLKGSKTYNYWRARGRVHRVSFVVVQLAYCSVKANAHNVWGTCD